VVKRGGYVEKFISLKARQKKIKKTKEEMVNPPAKKGLKHLH